MKDRFLRGLLAGVTGGIAMNALSYPLEQLIGAKRYLFIEWSAIMLFGDRIANTGEMIVALGAQLLWSGFLGILLAYLYPLISSRGYLLKGALFGFVLCFFMTAIPVLLNVRYLQESSLATTIGNIVGALIWGMTTAYVLKYLDKKTVQ